MHICVIMRTFQIEPTSLASCLFITYIWIVFSFIIYVFGMFCGAHAVLTAPFSSPLLHHSTVTPTPLCLGFRRIMGSPDREQVAEWRKEKRPAQSSDLPPVLRNGHQRHCMGPPLVCFWKPHVYSVRVWLGWLVPLAHCFF